MKLTNIIILMSFVGISSGSFAMEGPSRLDLLKSKGLNDQEAKCLIESFERDVENNPMFKGKRTEEIAVIFRPGPSFEEHPYVKGLADIYLVHKDQALAKLGSTHMVFFVLRKVLFKTVYDILARDLCKKLNISENSSFADIRRAAFGSPDQALKILSERLQTTYFAFASFREGEPDKTGFYFYEGKEIPTNQFPW